jgi:hypothetical protein
MKILDELELLKQECKTVFDTKDEAAFDLVADRYFALQSKALPALVRVARAAEAYNVSRGAKAGRELEEALQQLRNLHAAEMTALQQEMGLDD